MSATMLILRAAPARDSSLGMLNARHARNSCRHLGRLSHHLLVPATHTFRHHFSLFSPLRTDNNQKQPAQPTKPLATLRENIYTIPNLLTVSRIVACPVLGWAIVHDNFEFATALLVYAGLTDTVCSSHLLSQSLMSRAPSQGGWLHRPQVQDDLCTRNYLGPRRGQNLDDHIDFDVGVQGHDPS